MDARKMLMENGRGTAADQGFVQQVSAKWAPLLEGIGDDYARGVTAMLLENQAEHLKSLHEETLSTGIGPFTKYIFPILRRVFPNLIANSIVSVQPMTAPIGGIFTYEYKYGDTKGNATQGNNLIGDFQKHYSSEFVDNEVKVAAADVDGIKVIWSNATNPTERIPFKFLPLRPLEDIGTYQYRVTLNWTSGAAAQQQVDDGAGGFTGDGNPAGSSVDYTAGTWAIDTTGAVPDAGTPIFATYFYNSELVANTTAPGAGVTAAAYANTDQVSKVPEVNIDIALSTVRAGTRKLKARWSAEAVDDLRAFHGLSAETELVAGISNEIALELDREIICDLVDGASHSIAYTHGPNFGGQPTMTDLDSIRRLLTQIESLSATIHRTSLRAPGNFIVTSPAIAALFAQLTSHGDFMMVNRAYDQDRAPSYGPMNSNFGIQRIGTLMNKYAVYQDPYLENDKCLVGLKGSSFLDAGYVYAPYVPLQVTPTFLDPDDFTFRKGLRTRYAKKLLRPEYYGVMTVAGLPTVVTV
jgi:hypothetical protein